MYLVPVKSKVKISQNFVAFSEYMNFNPPTPTMGTDNAHHLTSPFGFSDLPPSRLMIYEFGAQKVMSQ